MARVDEVGDGIYRISTTVSLGEGAFQSNQFLIDDERPALIHTGMFPMYEDVRKAVAEVLDPASLAYVVCPHFEADECGGMDRFEKLEPQWIHPMHGGSLPKEVVPNYTRALREEEFAFEGKIFGRMIPG
jgi:glyoxylase-like metal-dependent hydrolase (beta-lactamase superfamily II)